MFSRKKGELTVQETQLKACVIEKHYNNEHYTVLLMLYSEAVLHPAVGLWLIGSRKRVGIVPAVGEAWPTRLLSHFPFAHHLLPRSSCLRIGASPDSSLRTQSGRSPANTGMASISSCMRQDIPRCFPQTLSTPQSIDSTPFPFNGFVSLIRCGSEIAENLRKLVERFFD